MKTFLKIAVPVLAVGVLVMFVMGYLGSKANDDALAAIKDKPGVIVLEVSGMT